MNEHVYPIFRPIVDAIAPQPDPLLLADGATIRAAIMDVIDSGTADVKCWMLYEWEGNGWSEDDANLNRLLFADEVEKRIQELQNPPHHLGIKLENYCHRHLRAKLPPPTVVRCVDCDVERTKERLV